eukprot:TRINITY_DN5569_c1_g2_i1.p1 TRINITY_DN5569_c1_g2~~TRINITY_DN5569_c1_g2_i1.p1  ORF type:complete len:501 (-),score=169.69 TRINITY_DN5569_c1_g2_i1:214-1716(-)
MLSYESAMPTDDGAGASDMHMTATPASPGAGAAVRDGGGSDTPPVATPASATLSAEADAEGTGKREYPEGGVTTDADTQELLPAAKRAALEPEQAASGGGSAAAGGALPMQTSIPAVLLPSFGAMPLLPPPSAMSMSDAFPRPSTIDAAGPMSADNSGTCADSGSMGVVSSGAMPSASGGVETGVAGDDGHGGSSAAALGGLLGTGHTAEDEAAAATAAAAAAAAVHEALNGNGHMLTGLSDYQGAPGGALLPPEAENEKAPPSEEHMQASIAKLKPEVVDYLNRWELGAPILSALGEAGVVTMRDLAYIPRIMDDMGLTLVQKLKLQDVASSIAQQQPLPPPPAKKKKGKAAGDEVEGQVVEGVRPELFSTVPLGVEHSLVSNGIITNDELRLLYNHNHQCTVATAAACINTVVKVRKSRGLGTANALRLLEDAYTSQYRHRAAGFGRTTFFKMQRAMKQLREVNFPEALHGDKVTLDDLSSPNGVTIDGVVYHIAKGA